MNMAFGTMDTGDVLESFDFDAFLQADDDGLNFDQGMGFGNYEGLEQPTDG